MENLFLLFVDSNIIAAVVVAILGGGILTGMAVYRKTKPEISKITVEIAGQAVIVQKGVIDSLQNELLRMGTDLRTVETENERLDKELRSVKIDHEKCHEENEEFRRTIRDLESRLKGHSVRMDKIEENNDTKI